MLVESAIVLAYHHSYNHETEEHDCFSVHVLPSPPLIERKIPLPESQVRLLYPFPCIIEDNAISVVIFAEILVNADGSDCRE